MTTFKTVKFVQTTEIKTGKENDLQTKSRRCISLGINKRQRIHQERKKLERVSECKK